MRVLHGSSRHVGAGSSRHVGAGSSRHVGAGSSRHVGAGRDGGGVRARDPRLDVFRGLAMFIIVIAHTPGNPWTLWIPARFGFSDATEIFVFCSGIASALAFGAVFGRAGWRLGTALVLHRVWQVYRVHRGCFVTIAALMALLDAAAIRDRSYVGQLNLVPFFSAPETNLPGRSGAVSAVARSRREARL